MPSCLSDIFSVTGFMAVTDIMQVTDLVAFTDIMAASDIIVVTYIIIAVTDIIPVTEIIAVTAVTIQKNCRSHIRFSTNFYYPCNDGIVILQLNFSTIILSH